MTLEDFDGREPLYRVFFSETFVLCGFHRGQNDAIGGSSSVALERSGCFFPLWCQSFAMATPWSEKLYDKEGVFLNSTVKVLGSEVQHVFSGKSPGESEQQQKKRAAYFHD